MGFKIQRMGMREGKLDGRVLFFDEKEHKKNKNRARPKNFMVESGGTIYPTREKAQARLDIILADFESLMRTAWNPPLPEDFVARDVSVWREIHSVVEE
jgi:hypothetical protein